MGRERVDSFTEAKHLSEDHKKVRPDKTGPDIHAGGLHAHGASGVGMDGISVDYAELTRLNGQLQGLRDKLVEQQSRAAELTGPLADGSSPVTGPMRKAFFQRADVQEGVQGTLQDYIKELEAVMAAISNTLNTYQGVDGFAGSRFEQLANQEGVD